MTAAVRGGSRLAGGCKRNIPAFAPAVGSAVGSPPFRNLGSIAMKPDRLAHRWKRRHAQEIAEVRRGLKRCRQDGDGEAVHELRVALRRLRLLVRVGRGRFDEAVRGQFREWAGRVSRATSPVRDLDIAIEWLRNQQAGAGVVGPLQQRRDRAWRRHRLQVIRPPARLWSALAAPRKPGRAAGVARRFHKLTRRYRDELRAVLPRFEKLTEEERHEFRRTVRWWRYLRELDAAKGKPAADAAIRRLLPVQEALGEVQNLALVESVVESLPPSAEREGLRAVLARQQEAQRVAVARALAALGRWLR